MYDIYTMKPRKRLSRVVPICGGRMKEGLGPGFLPACGESQKLRRLTNGLITCMSL